MRETYEKKTWYHQALINLAQQAIDTNTHDKGDLTPQSLAYDLLYRDSTGYNVEGKTWGQICEYLYLRSIYHSLEEEVDELIYLVYKMREEEAV